MTVVPFRHPLRTKCGTCGVKMNKRVPGNEPAYCSPRCGAAAVKKATTETEK